MIITTFFCTFFIFLAIGWASALWQRGNRQDFYLANQNIHPTAAALSAVSTNLSGFLFIGIIGMTWKLGFFAIFLFLCIMLGNFTSWLLFSKPLRNRWDAHTNKPISFSEFIVKGWSTKKANTPHSKKLYGTRGQKTLQIILAIITILFLSTYAAGQLNASGKALQALFGWAQWSGVVLTTLVVLGYCLAGGLRATIWTDAAQSIVMFIAMGIMVMFCFEQVAGFSGLYNGLAEIDTQLVKFIPEQHFPIRLIAGFSMFLLGLGVIGQPHIMVRAIALRGAENMGKVRTLYFGYYSLFCSMALFVGLCCKVLLQTEAGFDPELALPTLAMAHLPAVLTGIVLAGIFASTMSTADSQILAVSTTLMEDLLPPKYKHNIWFTKGLTCLVILGVMLIALFATLNVAQLVMFSWAALAVTLGPLIVIRVLNKTIVPAQAVLMVISATFGSYIWLALGLTKICSEVLPGLIISAVVYFAWRFVAVIWDRLKVTKKQYA